MEVHQNAAEPWRMTLVDTGDRHDDRRALKARPALPERRRAFLPHLRRRRRDVNIGELIEFHKRTARSCDHDRGPAAGALRRLEFEGDLGPQLQGKAGRRRRPGSTAASSSLDPSVLDSSRATGHSLGTVSLSNELARDGELVAYRHRRVLAPDGHAARQNYLEELWQAGKRRGNAGRRRFWKGRRSSSPAIPVSRAAG